MTVWSTAPDQRMAHPRLQPAEVFGELSANGRDIAIIVTGDPFSVQQAAAKLAQLTPKGTVVGDGHALTMPCTWPTVVQLSMTFGPAWHYGGALQRWMVAEADRRVSWSSKPFRYPLPAGLALKPWQPEAVRMVAHLGCLLEDSPRLGKTITTIAGLAERACWPEYVPVVPIVVVCPASVVTAWCREFALWAPHWRVVAWRGGNKLSRKYLVGRYDVYVVSYDTARNDATAGVPESQCPLLRIKHKTTVIDEFHYTGNANSKQTKATQRLARHTLVIPLSGSGFVRDFSNMQPILEVFEPGAFDSKERIADRYCLTRRGDYRAEIVGLNQDKEPELRACFLGRRIGRSREDVRSDLNEKTYSTRVVSMPPKYTTMYEDMASKMIAELDSGEEVSVLSTNTKMLRLQQLSASSCEVHYTYTTDELTGMEKEHIHLTPILPSWKIEAMLDVLAELSWPAIAFGLSKPLMLLAGQAAEKAGARVGYVVGAQSTRVRDENVDSFQAGKLDLLCVVTQAGGVGLTLNAAGTEIFLQRPCSFVQSTQAEDRGIGTRYPTLDVVDIFAETASGVPTVDLRIRQILHTKAGQLGEWRQDPRIVRQLFGGELRPRRAIETLRNEQKTA
jgi:SNF2 family DNA or RNA helicase